MDLNLRGKFTSEFFQWADRRAETRRRRTEVRSDQEIKEQGGHIKFEEGSAKPSATYHTRGVIVWK